MKGQRRSGTERRLRNITVGCRARERSSETDTMSFQPQPRISRSLARKVLLLALFLLLLLIPILGQQPFDGLGGFRPRQRENVRPPEPAGPSFGEYTFTRTIYDSPFRGRRGGTWSVDYPEADNNFIVGLREWAGTNLKIAPRPEQIPIMDDRIFDYPLIYFVEPGFLELSSEQAARLREDIMRGGVDFF